MTDGEPGYEVFAGSDGYEVRRPAGDVVLQCADEANAQHYAVLMNQAFAAGFKAGFRAARRDG